MADIVWDQLDKPRYFALQTAWMCSVDSALLPFEVLRTKQQFSRSPVHVSMGRLTRDLAQQEGVHGLFRGFTPVVLGGIPLHCLYYGTYEASKHLLSSVDPNLLPRWAVYVAAGVTADAVSLIGSVPIDVLGMRMMVSKHPVRFTTVAKATLRREGPRGFYRGFWATVATHAPASGVWWLAYEELKQLLPIIMPALRQREEVSHFFSGLGASVGAIVLSNPLDVVKTRIQTKEGATTVRMEMSRLLRHEGAKGLLKGIGPRVLSAAPQHAIVISGYEIVKRWSLKET